jgi:hypothetical protein
MMRDTAHAEVAPNAEQNNFCLLNKVCVVFIFSISSFGSILSGEVICCNTAVGDAQGNSKVEEVKKMSPSGRMEAIEKHFHSGETRYGLYSTGCAEQRPPRATRRQAHAIALRGVPRGGGWPMCPRETRIALAGVLVVLVLAKLAGMQSLEHLRIFDSRGDCDLVSGGGKPVAVCPYHLYRHCFWPFWHRWCSDCLATAQEHYWLDPLHRRHRDRDDRF